MEGEEKLKDAVSHLLMITSKKKGKSSIEKKTTERTKRKIVAKQRTSTRRSIQSKTIDNKKEKNKKKNVRVRRQTMDGDTTETDEDAIRETCEYKHAEYSTNYAVETDKRYFSMNGAIGTTFCRICSITIGDQKCEFGWIPSVSNKVYVCLGRNHFKCKQTIYGKCYNAEIIKDKPINHIIL